MPNFVKKIAEGDMPLSGKFIPKILYFADLVHLSHISKAMMVKFGARGADLGVYP